MKFFSAIVGVVSSATVCKNYVAPATTEAPAATDATSAPASTAAPVTTASTTTVASTTEGSGRRLDAHEVMCPEDHPHGHKDKCCKEEWKDEKCENSKSCKASTST